MCLIFLSLNNHPKYKLIVAANRDEFYQRKTAAAEFWSDHPEILGGRDLEASGTWMAMHKNGRIAMVTNYRDLKNLKQTAPSRGALVSDFLLTDITAEAYLRTIEPKADAYNGFNLLVGNVDALYYLSNYKQGIEKLNAGIHGLSNALLNTPWPKVEKGKEYFASLIKNEDIDPEVLFKMLYNEERASDNLLPDTGVGLERERMLSSMFIKSPNYGTRCSTVVLVDHHNHVQYHERVYDLQTFAHDTRTYELTV
ncbi:MAG: NRDE family protein [Cytophagia bacterium]|nr:NRDE family protein [Cytophagia bacterium]